MILSAGGNKIVAPAVCTGGGSDLQLSTGGDAWAVKLTTASKSSPRAAVAMSASKTSVEFEKIFLPHLNAAYNLARLLLRDRNDAEDVVQESYLKAMRAFAGFRGDSARPWLLTIVRNTAFSWLRANRSRGDHAEYNDAIHGGTMSTPEVESLGNERSRAIGSMCGGAASQIIGRRSCCRRVEELSYSEIT